MTINFKIDEGEDKNIFEEKKEEKHDFDRCCNELFNRQRGNENERELIVPVDK